MSLTSYLSGFLTILRNVIAEQASRDHSRIPFLVPIHGRLNRLAQRFERLYNRWQNGTLPKPRTSSPAKPRITPGKPRLRIPTRRMWLLRELKSHIANIAVPRMEHFLVMPELPEFLAAAPQAGRILRPLCHMIGVKLPDILVLPKTPRPPRRRAPAAQTPEPPAPAQCTAHAGKPRWPSRPPARNCPS